MQKKTNVYDINVLYVVKPGSRILILIVTIVL